jgi:iron complex outermembrane receptor protein
MVTIRRILVAAGAVLALPLNVISQTVDSIPFTKQLEEVTVTAQKQEENLQKIPVAVSHIPEEEIRHARIWQARDIGGIFPNFYASHSGDGRNVMGIRGITTTSYDPAVAVYVDGVIQFGLDNYSNGLLDVERIEVLRGPQGTLYGRNAMGGVINIITKKPTNQTRGFAELGFGNYGMSRYSLGLKTALVPNKLFLGVSGLYERHNGFYTNEFSDSDYDKRNTLLGNYYLRYLANPYWSFTLNFKHSGARNNGAFPLAGSFDEAFDAPFRLNQNTSTTMVDNVSNASLVVNYAGTINFSSQTSFQSNYRIYEDPIDGDFSPLDIVSIVNNYGEDWNKVNVWTQEFRLFSEEGSNSKFSWLVGLFGFVKEDPVKQGTFFGENGDIYGSQPNTTLLTTNMGKNNGIALFGQGNYRLSERLDLTLGLRYDRENRELTGKGEFLMEGMDPIVIQPDTTGKADFSALSPKVALSYDVSDDQMLFLSYSRGFRAGGLSQVTGNPSEPALRTYDPEFSNNFELGLKNEFLDKRIRWNLSTFYSTVKDIQVPQLILPEAFVVTTNEGELTSMGLESEFTALLGNNLMLAWNAGYTDAQFKELIIAGEQDNVSLEGNKQLFTPEFTSNFILQYNKTIDSSRDIQLLARAEWMWLGTTYFDLQNQLKQDPYHLVNARVAAEKGPVSLAVWARNILDTRYVDYAYNFGAAHLGEPATYGVSLRVDF